MLDARLLDWLCSLARQNADPAGISLDWNALGYFPPTYLVASDGELLRDDSKRLEAALRAQHVPVTSAYWPGLPHAFPLLHRYLPEARAATDSIRAWLDNLHGGR